MTKAPFVGAIIQARMGSSRLPGKVLMDIAGASMLARVVTRVRAATTVQQVVVATTTSASDDPIAESCARLGVALFRGSEPDVLDRYYQAAVHFGFDVVVRVTSDCPLLDPAIIDKVVQPLLEPGANVDFAANTLDRTFPRGLDVEVASIDALRRVWQVAQQPYERAHVFPYIYEHRDEFETVNIASAVSHATMRWTVDTPEDLAFVREVAGAMAPDVAEWRTVLALVARHPEWLALNQAIRQKAAGEL